MVPKTGKALETLVAVIERAIADKANVTVEARKRLRCRVTKRLREHDVLVTIRQNHHTVLIAIECRDRSRPVTVEQVDAFSRKCRDTGIDQGVIVSVLGFSQAARTKAKHLHIRCLDVEQAMSFDWMAAASIQNIVRHLVHQNWHFNIRGEEIAQLDKTNKEVLDENGVPITGNTLRAFGHRLLDEIVPSDSEPIERAEFWVRFGGSGYSIRDKVTDETTPIHEIVAELTYSIHHQVAPFKLFKYGTASEGKTIAEAAVAEFDVGNLTASLILVNRQTPGAPFKIRMSDWRAVTKKTPDKRQG